MPRLAHRLARIGACLSLMAALAPNLHAHSAGENVLTLSADQESLEAMSSLSLESASALLPPGTQPPLNAETFAQHRAALQTAAARACTLLDSKGAPIEPRQVIVSFHDGHEVQIHCIYPLSVQPARVRMPLLAELRQDAYCEVNDTRPGHAQRGALTPARPELALGGKR